MCGGEMQPANLSENNKPTNYDFIYKQKQLQPNVSIVSQTNTIYSNTVNRESVSEKKIFLSASPRKENKDLGRSNINYRREAEPPLLLRRPTEENKIRHISPSKSLDSINNKPKIEVLTFTHEEFAVKNRPEKSKKSQIDIKQLKEDFSSFHNSENVNLLEKVNILNEWYSKLKVYEEDELLSDEMKFEFDELSKEVDRLGQINVSEFFYKMQKVIIENNISSTLSYPLNFWSILSKILFKYPHACDWIKSFDPNSLIKLISFFSDSVSHSFDYILKTYKEKGDDYIQSQMTTLVSDCYLICQAFSPQNIDPSEKKQGLVWEKYEALLLEKLSNHWRTTSPPKTMPRILCLNDFFSKICKKKKEDLHEKLAFSLAYTFVVLRIDIISRFDFETIDRLFHVKKVAKYFKEAINLSEKISSFVEFSILSKETPEKRARLMEAFINAAMNCLELGDLETCAAIHIGVSQSSIQRLKHTKKHISEKASANERKIEQLFSMSNNFGEYRKFVKDRMTYIIPSIAILLKDLEFATNGNEGDSKRKWQEKIGEELLRLVYYTKVHALYLEMTGQYMFPIPDLKMILRDESFKFTENSSLSSALLIRSKYLE
jgi:hypothetical protein